MFFSVITLPLKIDVYKGDKIVIRNLLDMLFSRRNVVETLKIVKDLWPYPILHDLKSKRKENERKRFHFLSGKNFTFFSLLIMNEFFFYDRTYVFGSIIIIIIVIVIIIIIIIITGASQENSGWWIFNLSMLVGRVGGKSKAQTDLVSEFATVCQEVQRQSRNCSGVSSSFRTF